MRCHTEEEEEEEEEEEQQQQQQQKHTELWLETLIRIYISVGIR
jgi:hypothetical protein